VRRSASTASRSQRSNALVLAAQNTFISGRVLSRNNGKRFKEKMIKRLLDRIMVTPAGGYFVLAVFAVLGIAVFSLYWARMDEVPIWAYKIAVLYFSFYLLGKHVGREKE
jgi:hypothetical protein